MCMILLHLLPLHPEQTQHVCRCFPGQQNGQNHPAQNDPEHLHCFQAYPEQNSDDQKMLAR
uniref:Uncharacterized protein n=1 Tax=Arundo donax TaxID=35708 RepID=A0A0A9CKT5_ARUDO